MTKELARWRHRIDLGDVIQSPRGEYVLWEDYDKLAKDFTALQSQWDDMQQGLLEVFGEPVQDAIELLGATEQLRSAVEPPVQLLKEARSFIQHDRRCWGASHEEDCTCGYVDFAKKLAFLDDVHSAEPASREARNEYPECRDDPRDCPYVYCHSTLKCARAPALKS